MTVTINGSSGITAPEVILDNTTADGGQVVLKSSGYSNWNLDNYSGRLRAYYNSTEYFTVNSSGNVGIGTSSPSGKLNVSGSGYQYVYVDGGASTGGSALVLRQGTTNSIAIGNYAAMNGFGSSNDGVVQASNGNMQLQVVGANYMRFDTNNTERARIDSSGNLLVGTTSTIGGSCHALTGVQVIGQQVLTVAKTNQSINQNNNYYVQFNGSNGAEGYINTNGSAVLVISDASDRRVKENIVDATYGLNTIQALRPVEYSRIGETQRIKGFIAQEVKEVIPECVTIKDESAYGGLEDMHILEMQTMIPVLVKAIQEQQAIIESLKTRIETLENK